MKKKLMIIASCALLLLAAGCKTDEPTPPAPETFNSDVAAPTWAAPEVNDMTSSMTAVVKVDLKAQYPDKAADFALSEDDRLAAFIADSCVGATSLKEDLFFLYIASPTSNSASDLTSNSAAVTLRYYSAHYKNIFEAKDVFPFKNDDRLGTPDNPFVPTLVVAK